MGPRLVPEAAIRLLLGGQPRQGGRVTGTVAGGIQRHQRHRRGVGVAAPSGLELEATVCVLGARQERDGEVRRRRWAAGSHQSLNGERLGEGIGNARAVGVHAGRRAIGGVHRGQQILAPEAGGVSPGGNHRLDQLAARAGVAHGAREPGAVRQVGHHRDPRRRRQRVGVVAVGRRADGEQLAVRVALRDRPVRRLLGLQVEKGAQDRLILPGRREPCAEGRADRVGLQQQRERDLAGGEGVGVGVAGVGVAPVRVLRRLQVGERSEPARRPPRRERVATRRHDRLHHQRRRVRVAAGAVGPRLILEAAISVLLGRQPGQRTRVTAVLPGCVHRHQHHRRRVGVAGVIRIGGVVLDVLVVPAAVTVLGAHQERDGSRGHRGPGGHQPLDGERLGESLAVAVLAGHRVVARRQRRQQVLAAEGGGITAGGDHRLDQLAARPRVTHRAGGSSVGGQVAHHRGPRRRRQSVGVEAVGGRSDRVQLAVRVATPRLRDRAVRLLLRSQVGERARGGVLLGLDHPARLHAEERACTDETQCHHHGAAPAGSLHPTFLRRRSVSTSPKASSPP